MFDLVGMRDHPPIPVTDLADNIDRLKANDGLKFSQEYEVSLLGCLSWICILPGSGVNNLVPSGFLDCNSHEPQPES